MPNPSCTTLSVGTPLTAGKNKQTEKPGAQPHLGPLTFNPQRGENKKKKKDTVFNPPLDCKFCIWSAHVCAL